MVLMSLSLILVMLLAFIVMYLGKILKEKTYQDLEGSSPFECGFNPISLSQKIFSVRFFILGVIFLIFDIELVLLFPAFLKSSFFIPYMYLTMFIGFVILLSLGFYYEWNEKKIDWLSW